LTRPWVALMLVLGLAACGTDPVRETVNRLYEATTPPMGWASTLIYARETAVVNASWEVEIAMPWTVNRTGFIGGPIQREDGTHGTTQ
jgi:hypothetical protein